MKKISLLLIAVLSVFTITNAQISSECQKTCETEKVVQEGAFLGVKLQGSQCTNLNSEVIVLEVLENTAAEKFNLQSKDVILSIDQEKLINTKHLIDIIASHEPSDVIQLRILRKGENEIYVKSIVLGAKSTKIVKTTVCCDNDDKLFNNVNMTLYPNPTISSINFSMDDAEAGNYSFQIFNSVGAEVYVEVENFDAGFSRTIDLTDLSSGHYFMKVSKGANSLTKTFVISK